MDSIHQAKLKSGHFSWVIYCIKWPLFNLRVAGLNVVCTYLPLLHYILKKQVLKSLIAFLNINNQKNLLVNMIRKGGKSDTLELKCISHTVS